MFGLFTKKGPSKDEKLEALVRLVSSMLEMQTVPIGNRSIVNDRGEVNRKAAGYIYGFIDAALRSVRLDMSDTSIGIPVTVHVLRHLFPEHAEICMRFLI